MFRSRRDAVSGSSDRQFRSLFGRRWLAAGGCAALVLGVLIPLTLIPATNAGAAGYDSHLTRAPYLTDLVELTVNVNWATSNTGTGSLKWGPVTSGSCSLTNTVSNPTLKGITVGSVSETQWTAALSLPSQGVYCYRPMLGSTDLLATNASPQFHTQVAAGDTTPFTFDVMGDWGQVYATGNPDQANVMAQIAKSGARFAITVGDNGYNNGSQINYGDLQQTGADTSAIFGPAFWTVPSGSIPIFTAAGNHGLSNSAHTDISTWTEDTAVLTSGGTYTNQTYCCVNGTSSANYGSEWYAFNAGPARFYVLDSAWGDTNTGTASVYANDQAAHFAPGDPEYDWLLNDLNNNPTPLKFAFSHYPVYSDSPSQTSDTDLQGASRLEGLLGQHGVNIWFNGHAHIYERNKPSASGMPVTYITGGGGAALGSIGSCHPYDAYGIGSSSACGSAPKPSSASQVFHFLKVGVNGTSVTVTPTDENGNTFDQQTYNFGNANTPDTIIDSGPSTLTNATSATFSYHSTLSGATFACSLDNATPTPCGSSQGYPNLLDGTHTFSVVSTAGGITDPTPAVYAWTVKTTAPPPPTNLAASVVSAAAISLTWTGVSGAASYDIIRNGTTIATAAGTASSFLDNTLAPLSTYHYVIDDRDGAGNVSQPSNQTPDLTTPAGPTGPTLIQTAGSPTTTATLTNPSTPGNLLVLSAGVYTGTSQPITAVSDGKNTWTKIKASAVSGQYSDGEMWYTPNAASVSSVTVTTSASAVALLLQEYSGVLTTNPLEGSAGTAATSTTANSGTVTPSVSNDLAVGYIAGHGKNQAITVTSPGYNVDPTQTTTSPNIVSVIAGSQPLSSTSAQSFAGTFGTSMYWAAGIALFKAAAPPVTNDFSVSASPSSVSAVQGAVSGSSTITAPLVSGSAQTVTLSASGLPTGATASFNPAIITSDGVSSSALTISTTNSTPTGSYPVTVTGTGTATHTTTVTLTVSANSFTLSANPASVTATRGGTSGSSSVTAALTTGSTAQTVTLSATALPAGAIASFTPSTISSDGSNSSALTFTTSSSTPTGSYPVTVNGTGASSFTTGITMTLIVNAPVTNDFSVSASPSSVSAVQGAVSGSSTITAPLVSGSAQTVTLSASGLPTGATASFNPAIITSDGVSSSALTISTTNSTPTGSYPVTVTGTGTSTHTTTVTLTVSANSFTLSANPASVTATRGGTSGSSSVTAALTTGSTAQTVTLSATALPAGAIASFTPSTISSDGSSSSALSFSTSSSTPTGSYPVTVNGTGASSFTTGITMTLIVNAPVTNDFSVSASPSSVSAVQGAVSGSSTITAPLVSGSAQTVTLSASGLPTGATAS